MHHEALDVPPGDVLLHCGDALIAGGRVSGLACASGRSDLASFGRWMAGHPHPCKLFVPGNHDMACDPLGLEALVPRHGLLAAADDGAFDAAAALVRVRRSAKEALDRALPPSVRALVFESATTPGGLRVFGAPVSPRSSSQNSAFQYATTARHVNRLKKDLGTSPAEVARRGRALLHAVQAEIARTGPVHLLATHAAKIGDRYVSRCGAMAARRFDVAPATAAIGDGDHEEWSQLHHAGVAPPRLAEVLDDERVAWMTRFRAQSGCMLHAAGHYHRNNGVTLVNGLAAGGQMEADAVLLNASICDDIYRPLQPILVLDVDLPDVA